MSNKTTISELIYILGYSPDTVESRLIQNVFEQCLRNTGKDDTLWQHFAQKGEEINAIREYRRVYGATLIQSKNAVDAYCENHQPIDHYFT